VPTGTRFDRTVDTNRGAGGLAEGWTLSAHHELDLRDPRTMHRGDGGKVTSTAQILTTLAGTGATGFRGDGGPASQAQLNWPFRVTVHPSGDVYLADVRNNRIRKIDTQGIITTVAGTGSYAYTGDGGPATAAALKQPQRVAFDASGNMYIADTLNGCVRKVDTNGIISTVVSGLNTPNSVAVDSAENLYIAEQYANRVHKLDTNGVLTTLVSGGFKDITDLALDSSGNLYIADRYGCRVARLDTSAKMTTVAGTGSCGYSGDGGPASSARLGYLYGIALDAGGNLFIADNSSARVRRVDRQGIIATVAGNGTAAVGTEGEPATRTSLYTPFGIAVDPTGNIYVTEPDAPRVRKISTGARYSAPLQAGEIPFPEANGLGHVFSATGDHLKTLDFDSGTTLQTFEYDDQARLASITDRFGNLTTIERDERGLVTGILSPDGLRTGLAVDSDGHLTRITHPDGAHTDFEYTSKGLLTAKIEPNGNRYTHTFDSNGRLTDAMDGEGGNWHYSRSRQLNGETLVERTTAEGNLTSYLDRTDSMGAYTTWIRDPTGGETVYTSSADDLTARKSLSCGTVLDFQYGLDPHYKFKVARQRVETAPSNLKRTAVFDKNYEDTDGNRVPDRITEKATVNGKTATFLKDILRAKHTSTTPEGRTATLAYDPATLLASSSSIPGLYDTLFSYDERGRLTGVTTNSRETRFAYDERGNLSSVTDPEQRTTTYTHDALGRVTGVQRPDETTLGFSYDENGNMTVLTTPSAVGHDFGTNRVNLADSYETPLSGSYAYTYDRDRRLRTIRFPSGKTIENVYDKTNLDRVLTPEGEIDFSYLCASKVGTITMGAEQVSYGYDGSLVTTETLSGTIGATLGFTYNNDFRVSRMTYAGGAFDLGYDNDGLLTRSGPFTIKRNPQNGLPETVSGGPLSLARAFNGYGEMDGEIFRVNGADLHSWSVTRTGSGRIRSRTETMQGVSMEFTYDYDALGRLVSVTKDGTLVEEYGYGPNGNRIFERNLLRATGGRTFTYSDEDHLLASGDTTCEYDADGFLTSKTRGSQVTEYRYSSRGELLSATLPSGTLIEYLHDPLGRRIGKKINGTITEKYLWQGMSRLLAVYDGSDNLLMRFQYADSRMPLSMTRGAATYYLTYDQVGSLRAVSDATGGLVKRIDYDSFGNILSDSKPTFAMPFGFAGGLCDPDTTLVRFGFRDYDPDTGRWTAKDPILFGGGDTNLYGYVSNDPVNAVDPSGLIRIPGLKLISQKAVALAWRMEKSVVESGGRGTREWTRKEMKELLSEGKVCGYHGHHINSVAANPEMAGDPANIAFKTFEEHFAAHEFNWQNPTSGQLLDRTLRDKLIGFTAATLYGVSSILDAISKVTEYSDPVSAFLAVSAPEEAE
jgi:RHS repeat-associated protein